jgi:hypothetical protein
MVVHEWICGVTATVAVKEEMAQAGARTHDPRATHLAPLAYRARASSRFRGERTQSMSLSPG